MQRYISKELTHFVGRSLKSDADQYKALLQIVSSGHIKSSLIRELGHAALTIRYEKLLSENEMVVPEMVCFCDIPSQDFAIHQKKYSKFGISFLKSSLVAKGVRPVFYIPKNAMKSGDTTWKLYIDNVLRRHMGKSLEIRTLLETCQSELLDSFKGLLNFVDWEILGFMKFYEEGLADDEPKNFYMEREWRKLGSLKFEISDVCRIILPAQCSAQFRQDVPGYTGQISFAG
jgi:hypothetical protein